MEKTKFIQYMRGLVTPLMAEYGYNANCADAVVGMACVEGNYGESILAKYYHNHFGMKCGSKWNGASVNMNTKEYVASTNTTVSIKDNFRVYTDDKTGVVGFFEFINTNRYKNLHDCKTCEEWLNTIKSDGYATSSNYVTTIMKVISTFSENIKSNNTFSLVVGKNYRLLDNMAVRHAPSKNSPLVGYKGLTTDGKKHDLNKNGYLDKGTVITCKDVYFSNNEYWIKCPSGWICAKDATETYVEVV